MSEWEAANRAAFERSRAEYEAAPNFAANVAEAARRGYRRIALIEQVNTGSADAFTWRGGVCYETNCAIVRFEGLPPEIGAAAVFGACSRKFEDAIKMVPLPASFDDMDAVDREMWITAMRRLWDMAINV